MEISGGNKHRNEDERTGRSEDDLLAETGGVSDSPSDATESEGSSGSPLGVADDAPDTGVPDDTKAATPDAAGAESDTESADGVEGTETEEPAARRKTRKTRGLGAVKIDSDRIRSAWRANTLAKTALLAVCIYTLAVGTAYFLIMQPMGTRLHLVREQKAILHDYMAIQEASAAIGAFRDGLMTGDQRLTVMSEVKLMAEGSGVKIMGDAELLLSRDACGHFSEYPLRLRVRGTFHEVGEFLSLLEGSPRFTLVEEVEINSDVDSRERDSDATVLLALASWEE